MMASESVETAQGSTDTYSMGDSPGYSSGIDSEASSDIQEDISSDVLAYGIDLNDGKLSDVESVETAQGLTDTDSIGDSHGYSSGIDSEASSDIQEDPVMEEEVLEQQFEGFHQALF